MWWGGALHPLNGASPTHPISLVPLGESAGGGTLLWDLGVSRNPGQAAPLPVPSHPLQRPLLAGAAPRTSDSLFPKPLLYLLGLED